MWEEKAETTTQTFAPSRRARLRGITFAEIVTEVRKTSSTWFNLIFNPSFPFETFNINSRAKTLPMKRNKIKPRECFSFLFRTWELRFPRDNSEEQCVTHFGGITPLLKEISPPHWHFFLEILRVVRSLFVFRRTLTINNIRFTLKKIWKLFVKKNQLNK